MLKTNASYKIALYVSLVLSSVSVLFSVDCLRKTSLTITNLSKTLPKLLESSYYVGCVSGHDKSDIELKSCKIRSNKFAAPIQNLFNQR